MSEALLVDLDRAIQDRAHEEVARLCAELVASIRARETPMPEPDMLSALKLLQRKRYAVHVQTLAEVLLANGTGTVDVLHRYALALLDQNRIAAAEALLKSIPEGRRLSNLEVVGAIGRVHKQRYVFAGPAAGRQREEDLAAAIAAYRDAYYVDPGRNFYHGINAAVLLLRADRNGIVVPGHQAPLKDARVMATAILTTIEATASPTLWQFATAAEASLVLGQQSDALVWMARYVGSDADAFEYASTLRQLEFVWDLDAQSEAGGLLIPLLRNRLLQAEGGFFSVSPDEFTPASLAHLDDLARTLERRAGQDYERVYGWDRFQSIGWLHLALSTCRSVARVEDSWGDGYGTGFVVDGNHFGGDAWPRRVLLTNAHVVPEALELADTYLTFRGLADGPGGVATVRPVGDILWHSPKEDFDACFMALPDDLDDAVTPLEIRQEFPTLGTAAQPRAYVIGHPLGSPNLQVSLHDTRLLGADERHMHYRSPTETGSSGSPVFDERWRVIALHHGATDSPSPGLGPANEGIRMDRLITEVQRT